ncbi:hypothetical protein RRG08_050291, partial [Elysia crispata]
RYCPCYSFERFGIFEDVDPVRIYVRCQRIFNGPRLMIDFRCIPVAYNDLASMFAEHSTNISKTASKAIFKAAAMQFSSHSNVSQRIALVSSSPSNHPMLRRLTESLSLTTRSVTRPFSNRLDLDVPGRMARRSTDSDKLKT